MVLCDVYLTYGPAAQIREIKRDFSGFAGDWQTIAYAMAAGMCSPKSRASQPLHSTPKDGSFR